ncbi:MAG: lipase family protein [Gemmataceae bacterium]
MSIRWLFAVPFVMLAAGYPSPQLPAQDSQPKPTDTIKALNDKWDATDKNPKWGAALPLALLSRSAYHELKVVEEDAARLGLRTVYPVDTSPPSSMVAYVCQGDGVMVVVFRGTDDRADWAANLDFITERAKHGGVHRGFRKAFDSLKSDLFRRIHDAKPKRLWITGHSLGGALSAVCAMDLLEEDDIAIHGVMTFGQPMICHRGLALYLDEKLEGRFVHFVNKGDRVPQLPPLPRYRHFGRLVLLKPDGVEQRTMRRSSDEEPEEDVRPMSKSDYDKLRGEVVAEQKTFQANNMPGQRYGGQLPALRNHSMDLYVERVEKFMH